LFSRLDKLLEAGGFNEWLPATTDRDLCIRLADVGVVAAVTQQHTVHHFAPAAGGLAKQAAYDSSNMIGQSEAAPNFGERQQQQQQGVHSAHSRLSDPASAPKVVGLHSFHHDLWGPRMTADQRGSACSRALKLFGVDLNSSSSSNSSSDNGSGSLTCGVSGRDREPKSILAAAAAATAAKAVSALRPAAPDDTSGSSSSSGSSSDSVAAAMQPLVLVIGVVSSCAAVVEGLLCDLLLLLQQGAAASLLGGLEVVLTENGGCEDGLAGEKHCTACMQRSH
jgi:hypothetical protein